MIAITKDKTIYYLINGTCVLSALWLVIIGFRWMGGELISPIHLMNTLVVFAYSLCMVGFNWPDSKRMKNLRLFGLFYSLVMMVVSLLLVNDIISFQASWSSVVSGLSVSLMLSAIFQLYRIRSYESGFKKLYKWIMIGLSVLVFSSLGVIYLNAPDSSDLYKGFKMTLVAYSILMLGYFVMVALTVKDDRSRLKK